MYIPSLFNQPKYNFIYSSGYSYSGASYSVEKGKLVTPATPTPKVYSDTQSYSTNYSYSTTDTTKLFLYDVTKNQSTEVTAEEVQGMQLNSSTTSLDGYTITSGLSGENLLSYGTKYIKGHGVSKQINLDSESKYSFKFIGWVE